MVGQCSAGLIRRYLRYRHRAEVVFVIIEEYCNLGIGGKMMEQCLKEYHSTTSYQYKALFPNPINNYNYPERNSGPGIQRFRKTVEKNLTEKEELYIDL